MSPAPTRTGSSSGGCDGGGTTGEAGPDGSPDAVAGVAEAPGGALADDVGLPLAAMPFNGGWEASANAMPARRSSEPTNATRRSATSRRAERESSIPAKGIGPLPVPPTAVSGGRPQPDASAFGGLAERALESRRHCSAQQPVEVLRGVGDEVDVER